jgi:ribosome biogenesis GTPase
LQHLIDRGLPPSLVSALTPDELQDALSGSGDSVIARVAYTAHGHVDLRTGDRVVSGICHPSLREDPPVVGDWVVARTDLDPWIATRVLPREGVLRRRDPHNGVQRVAAHVDVALLCTAVGADLNLRRTERWLALAREAGATPVIVLTKADTGIDVSADVAALEALDDAPVVAVSGLQERGLDALRAHLPAPRTGALLGSSGVGKSTLLNALLDASVQATAAVRAGDDKGRHTTTARSLHPLPWGAWLIDNPGVREVGLVSEAGVGQTFEDLEALALTCRWRDCRHHGEDGCAVQAAVESGAVTPGRLTAWAKLQREAAHTQTRQQAGARGVERKKWKKNHQDKKKRKPKGE